MLFRSDLPEGDAGTLVLDDVAAMSLVQQLELDDWIRTGGRDVQVISVTSTHLERLVESGQFLEALYEKLSIVRLGDRGEDSLATCWDAALRPVATKLATS